MQLVTGGIPLPRPSSMLLNAGNHVEAVAASSMSLLRAPLPADLQARLSTARRPQWYAAEAGWQKYRIKSKPATL